MMRLEHGVTRQVLLVGRYAIKVPQTRYTWRNFLQGLLANMQERQWSAAGLPGLCPVLWAAPGGWLLVMPRVSPLDADLSESEYEALIERGEYRIPAEPKIESWGRLNGTIVAVDYGS